MDLEYCQLLRFARTESGSFKWVLEREMPERAIIFHTPEEREVDRLAEWELS